MTWSVRDRATFGELRTKGRRVRRGPLLVTHVPAVAPAPTARPRVAYAVARRVGPAVVRNRVRRRLRAAVAELARQDAELLSPGAYLITPAPPAAAASQQQLRHHLLAALQALHSTPAPPRRPR